MRSKALWFLLVSVLSLLARPASAHPAPFSYLDLRLAEAEVRGTLVVHDFDAGYELGLIDGDLLLDPKAALGYRDELVRILSARLTLLFDGQRVKLVWGAIDVVPERQSLRLNFTVQAKRPGHAQIRALVFPYDPQHQTFVNLYDDGALAQQAILDVNRQTADYYAGTTQGRFAVVKTFVLSGIHHILIGPDHILFLIGLLLLRGSIGRLALIVTAFTLGHSVTLSLAALDILSPPSRLIEPLIALTIIVVGADNLLVLRGAAPGVNKSADIRAGLAAVFGLVHGFGFASVLKEFGLPRAALGWSLFAFNVGVELGQLMIVTVVAALLGMMAHRSPIWGRRTALGGSVGVILAGAYWFVERTFFPGGL